MKQIVGVLAITAILQGCVSAEKREAEARAQRARIATEEDAQCRSYGAQPGTQPYFQCRLTLHQQRTALAAAAQMQEDANRSDASIAMMGMGTQIMRGGQ
jgi:hypothetical protein